MNHPTINYTSVSSFYGKPPQQKSYSSSHNKDDYSTLEAFHSHVEDIIKGEDYDILGADEFPKSKDFDGQLDITKDSTWEDICNAYKLTKIKKDFLSDNTDKNE